MSMATYVTAQRIADHEIGRRTMRNTSVVHARSQGCAVTCQLTFEDLSGRRVVTLRRFGAHTIGSHPASDVHVSAPTVALSHALFFFIGGDLEVQDLGTTGGTFVDEHRICGSHRVMLGGSARFAVGTVEITIELRNGDSAESESSAAARESVPRSWSNLSSDVDCVSAAMRRAYEFADVVAASELPVLIQSRSSADQERLASFVDDLAGRRLGPLVRINCTAMSTDVIETASSGTRNGAPASNVETLTERVAAADGGTVVLDEVGDLSLDAQAQLLRFVRRDELPALQGCASTRVDVRIIATTTRELSLDVIAGRFRVDLLYYIHGLVIMVPPFRERLAEMSSVASCLSAR